MKKEKALAASGNMITTPFNDAKAMGHTRGLIAEHGYIDWEGVFLAVEDSIRVFEPPTGTFQNQISRLQHVPCSLWPTLVNITFSIGAIRNARYR